MPHAIYLHSGLTQARFPFANVEQRRKALVMSKREVLLALGVAGLVNVAMIILGARASHNGAHDQIAEIEKAYRTLAPLLGLGAAGLFMLALLASGFSSSIVAVMAGQAIMQGFVSFRVPLWLRRLLVMTSSFVVVAAGMDITHALVLSQVVLSLVLPLPMVALVRFTASRDVMGEFANARLTNVLAVAATGFVCLLNGLLLLAIAAQMIPTSLAGTRVSLPNAHLTSWRPVPALQVTTSYRPTSYISAPRDRDPSRAGDWTLVSIPHYGNFEAGLAVCAGIGNFSRMKEYSNGPDETVIHRRRSDRRDPARRRNIGCAHRSAGHPDGMSAEPNNYRDGSDRTYGCGRPVRLPREKKMSALLEYGAATAGLESNRRVKRSCKLYKITSQPNSLSRLE